METYTIDGTEYSFFGKKNGSNECKFNRVAKLAAQFDCLIEKFDGIIERGNGETLNARLALAVKLLMTTGIRIGNEASAEGYMTQPHPNNPNRVAEFVKTYGLTTLKRSHVKINHKSVVLNFTGKASVENCYRISDPVLVVQIQAASISPDLWLGITPKALSKFIKIYVGSQFTPKDFRTLKANMEAWAFSSQLMKRQLPRTKTEANAEVKLVCQHVCNILNNTVGVCKSNYLDPELFDHLLNVRYYNA